MTEMDQIGLFEVEYPDHISDIGPVATKMFNFENAVTSISGFRSLKVIENDTVL